MYDETYDVIYDWSNYQKIQGLHGAFLIFENRYIICRVSDARIQRIHYKLSATCILSLTSTAGRTSRALLADVIPWINKASLALYLIAPHTACHAATNPMFRSCMALSSSSPVIENCLVSRSRVGLRLHLCDWGTDIDVAALDCVRTILTTYYHNMIHYAATGHVVKFSY